MSLSFTRFGALVVSAFAGLAVVATSADAAATRHRIDVDTSSIAGQSVDLFFAASGYNDGPGSAVGNVAVVSNFTSDALLVPPATPFGLTTGDLDSTLNLPFNHENGGVDARAQYLISAVLGNHLSFEVTLHGDQLEGSNVVPYAGFEFTFNQGLSPLWLSPAGFASAEVYRADGQLLTDAHANITVTQVPVPEPAGLGVLGLAVLAASSRRRRRPARIG